MQKEEILISAIAHNSPDTVPQLSDQPSNLETWTNILCIGHRNIYKGNEAVLAEAKSTAVSQNSLFLLDFIKQFLKFYQAIYINTAQEKDISTVDYMRHRCKSDDCGRCSVLIFSDSSHSAMWNDGRFK